MSLVKKICLGFLVVLLLLIGGLAFLIGTTTGLHMVINGAARWVPGLEIAGSQRRLARSDAEGREISDAGCDGQRRAVPSLP
jgi:autotransporter translocation and assembly factor TamB